jgi:hypothetical protein
MPSIFRYLILVFILSILWSPFCPGQTQRSTFKEIFESYNKARQEGIFEKIISFYTSEVQNEITSQVKSEEERKEFLSSGKVLIPESYEILHMEAGKDSQSYILHTILQFSEMKEIKRERSRIECDIHYKKENNQWKLESLWYLTDPDKIVRPHDFTFNSDQADLDKEGSIGGRIVRTEFNPGYTIVIIRVLDEENAVFFKSKEELLREGISLKELEPWKVYEFSGHPHKTDKLKFFATSGKPVNN